MKNQNNDRKKFDEKFSVIEYPSGKPTGELSPLTSLDEIWSWIQSYTQKKVEEQRTELLEEILEKKTDSANCFCDVVTIGDITNLLNKKDETK